MYQPPWRQTTIGTVLIFSFALTPLFFAIYFESWLIAAVAYGPMIFGLLLVKLSPAPPPQNLPIRPPEKMRKP